MKRDGVLHIRVTVEQKARLAEAAGDCGMSVSEWVRTVVLVAAGASDIGVYAARAAQTAPMVETQTRAEQVEAERRTSDG